MKKWLISGLAAMMLLTVFNVAYGARTIKLIIRGEQAASDAPVEIVNGRAMVPLRLVAEQLHEEVRWDAKSGAVHVAPDLWEQDLRRHISREDWVYARNIIIRFLIAFDERDDAGKQLVGEDFDANFIGPEVVIPLPGVGMDLDTMVDFKFVDAKWDDETGELTVRVKIFCWTNYIEDRKVKIWDFTLRPDRSGSEPRYKIKKIWQVEERKLAGYNAFPGLHFKMEQQ
jgi:hypothetical protein